MGGISAKITGGRFEDGVVSAVLTWLFNHENENLKKLFVKTLEANGLFKVQYTFSGGREIFIEAKANAALGRDSFIYNVKSYLYDQSGHVLKSEIISKNSTVGNHGVTTGTSDQVMSGFLDAKIAQFLPKNLTNRVTISLIFIQKLNDFIY